MLPDGSVVSSATFTPPTGTMGRGDTFISLAFARQQLANDGITQPMAEQVQTSLMGGPKSPQGKSGIVTGAGTAGGGVTSPLGAGKGQGAGAAAGGKGADGGVRGRGKD